MSGLVNNEGDKPYKRGSDRNRPSKRRRSRVVFVVEKLGTGELDFNSEENGTKKRESRKSVEESS